MTDGRVVYAVLKIREGIPYADPGAEEVESIHATEAGAREACAAKTAKRTWKHDDTFEVREFEVMP